MEFVIRTAVEQDISEIMHIMYSASAGKTLPEWYITDDEESVRNCLNGKGYILVSETNDGKLAGFFIVKYPDEDENLGKYLGYSEAQLEKVILMDSVAILPQFRGNGLQGKLLEEAERRIDTEKYHYSMCTIHPDNIYSLGNMQKHGYEVKKTVKCYGENIRHVLVKEI